MLHELTQDQDHPRDWRVESTGSDGECYVVIFAGPKAEERAREYAGWKNAMVMA